jgi:hypothetical protein
MLKTAVVVGQLEYSFSHNKNIDFNRFRVIFWPFSKLILWNKNILFQANASNILIAR